MAANTSPAPRQGAEPDAENPPAVTAEPGKSKPVVLATRPLEEFILPAERDDKGKPKGDDIHVTPTGVALSKSEATRVLDSAKNHGVHLIEKKDEN